MQTPRLSPHFTGVNDYISFLESKGLFVSRDTHSRHSISKARHYIPRVGIQRFHNYFVDIEEVIRLGVDGQVGLDDVLRLYKFDRRLRLLALDAIERVEVAAKNYICRELERHYGPHFIFEMRRENHDAFDFSDLIVHKQNPDGSPKTKSEINKKRQKEGIKRVDKFSKDIVHNIFNAPDNGIRRIDFTFDELAEEVDSRLALDAMTLGHASKIYEVLNPSSQQQIAKRFGATAAHFGEWLYRMTLVRNLAAHHSRLWNVRYESPLGIPGFIHRDFRDQNISTEAQHRFYSTAIVLYFCLRKVARRTRWHWGLHELLDSKALTPEGASLEEGMGFPKNWNHKEFWRGASNARV